MYYYIYHLEMNRVKTLISRVDRWRTNIDDVSTLLDMAVENPSEAGQFKANNAALQAAITTQSYCFLCNSCRPVSRGGSGYSRPLRVRPGEVRSGATA